MFHSIFTIKLLKNIKLYFLIFCNLVCIVCFRLQSKLVQENVNMIQYEKNEKAFDEDICFVIQFRKKYFSENFQVFLIFNFFLHFPINNYFYSRV